MSTTKQYPWSHLISQIPEDDDDGSFVDIMDAQQSRKSLKTARDNLAETKDSFQSLEKISASTVDELETQLDTLKEELQTCQAALEEASNNNRANESQELLMSILTQTVIAHSRNLNPEETKRRILKGVLSWLTQRQRIMNYIREHNMNPELHDQVNAVLNLDKDTILQHIDQVFQPPAKSSSDESKTITSPPVSL